LKCKRNAILDVMTERHSIPITDGGGLKIPSLRSISARGNMNERASGYFHAIVIGVSVLMTTTPSFKEEF
jgi:hypothetical protein